MNRQSARQQDDQLIARTLEGDREAFGDLVRKYQDRLYNGMVQILRHEAEAEDTVQEAFILALTKLSSFRGKSGFYTWLFRIAYNTAITRIRKPIWMNRLLQFAITFGKFLGVEVKIDG